MTVCGINKVTIRKYEAGDRNPKPDQLLKIANSLGISINLFMDFDIETVSDVLSLIFKMDEQLDLEFVGKKNSKGEYDPKTLSIMFNNPAFNRKLATWAKTRDLVQNTIDARDEFENIGIYKVELAAMQSNADEIKQHLVDDNIIVKKNTQDIIVKINSIGDNLI